jgi:hypothetical protein
MGIFSGKGDINYTGVVGSTRDNDGDRTKSKSGRDSHSHSGTDDDTNEGVVHHGRGEVWINGKRHK